MAELTKENLTPDTVDSLRNGKDIVDTFDAQNVNETEILKFIQKGDNPTVDTFDTTKYNYYILKSLTKVQKYTGDSDSLLKIIDTGADAIQVAKTGTMGGRKSRRSRKSRKSKKHRKGKSRRSRR